MEILGTVALTDETWQENSKEYRGIAKVGMQAVGVVAGALNIGNGVTIAKSNKEHTTSQEEKASHLQADTISVGAQKVTAYGTTFDTDKSGSTTILGEDILLGTAKHSTQTTSTDGDLGLSSTAP